LIIGIKTTNQMNQKAETAVVDQGRAAAAKAGQRSAIVSEHNIDEWPNAGLSPIPGRPEAHTYGFIPPGLFAQIKAKFLELARQNKGGAVCR
jgi:hypothetical protein